MEKKVDPKNGGSYHCYYCVPSLCHNYPRGASYCFFLMRLHSLEKVLRGKVVAIMLPISVS